MKEITIENGVGNSCTILPSRGAAITALRLDNCSVIKYPLNTDDPKKGYPSAILFPFANRVKDGAFTFQGQTYRLNRNESGRNHAIHGFVAFEEFEVIATKKNSVTCAYDYNGEVAGYPFPFRLEITYTLGKQKLKLSYKITNTGTALMPCSFGWHPYFHLDSTKVSEWTLALPDRYEIELDSNMMPAETTHLFKKAEQVSLKNIILDDLIQLPDDAANPTSISLLTPAYKLDILQQTGKQQLRYAVLYIPPQRDCIAIEPQTASIDGLNNADGLIVLKPKQSAKGTIELLLTRIG